MRRKVRRVLMSQVGIACGSCRRVIPLGAVCERVMDWSPKPGRPPSESPDPGFWYRCRSCAEEAEG